MEPLDYEYDPLLDEEVNEALKRNDPTMIWGMVGTLASMDTSEWALNRAAIKKRFGTSINLNLLDKALKEENEPEEESKVSSSRPLEGWEKLLHRSEKGDFKPVLINADLALRNNPEWDGVLAFDEFKQKIRVVKTPPIGGQCPRDWTDTDDTNAAVWMQSKGIYVGRDVVSSAIQSVATANKIHVVRDYLNSLEWDGVPRIDTWLPTYMGAQNSELTRMVGPRWLISAVARIMSPGCQVDYMMVIEGVEGIKKSSALATLASQEWFCDHTPDLHDKDSQLQLSGAWIVEWPELENLRKSEITAVKQFLTRRVEKFRPPYGRYTIEMPRQCVFAGTTNELAWNKSDTGARRFWPFRSESTDNDALRRDRDQIWAEALTRYLDGSIWWPDTAEEHKMLSIEQDARIEEEPWQQAIEKYLDGDLLNPRSDEITVAELLSKCLGLPISEHDQAKKNRVGRALRSLGWNYVQERIPGTKTHFNGYKR